MSEVRRAASCSKTKAGRSAAEEEVARSPGSTAWVGQTRVCFGSGAIERLPAMLDRSEFGERIAIVASASQSRLGRVKQVEEALGGRVGGAFAEARVHTPQRLYAEAQERLRGASGLVALGGGAAIGLSKALAVSLELPLAAIPTTYSGSEMTAIYGIADSGEKRVRRSEAAQAKVVLYDPSLPLTMPLGTLRESLFNCLGHCLETAWLRDASPLGLALSESACHKIGAQAHAVARGDLGGAAGEQLMAAAWLGGVALAASGVGLHHAICHAIGGLTGAPHSAIHTVVLPLVARLNVGVCWRPQRMLASALLGGGGKLGEGSLLESLDELRRRWRLPRRLSEIGVASLDLGAVAERVTASADAARNVCPFGVEELHAALAAIA